MRHSLMHTAGNVVWAARNERNELAPLLAAYSRLKFRELVGSRASPTGSVESEFSA
jgi:hypothetical protein